jgi:phospholipid transport system substrate-binding protein
VTIYQGTMNILVRTALLSLLVVSPALAAPPEDAPVAALDAALIATMKSGSAGDSFNARYAALDPTVVQSFDMPVILQNSVGFLWSTVPADQQATLAKLFEQFTVASYVSQFNGFGGQQINILPAEKTLGDKKIVETQLVPSDGSAPTELDYVVAPTGSGWQITDVLLNGTISQVAVHASDFSALVTSGDASQLITALKGKVSALSGGALSP